LYTTSVNDPSVGYTSTVLQFHVIVVAIVYLFICCFKSFISSVNSCTDFTNKGTSLE